MIYVNIVYYVCIAFLYQTGPMNTSQLSFYYIFIFFSHFHIHQFNINNFINNLQITILSYKIFVNYSLKIYFSRITFIKVSKFIALRHVHIIMTILTVAILG